MAKQEQSFIAAKGKQFTKRNQFSFRFSYQYLSRKHNFIAAKGINILPKKSVSVSVTFSVLVFRTELENKVRLQQRVIFYKKIISFSVSRTKLKNKVSLQPRVNILQKEIECQSNFYRIIFGMAMVNSLMNETSF